MPNENIYPVIIVGMARSGTTLVSHILGSLHGVHIEVEPHALWKTGNFKYLNDEEFDITEDIVHRIKRKFIEDLNGEKLIEKSPINSLRPNLVYAVFPKAKIVYIERDPVRCIYSNYSRSVKKDSFKLSIILKKYFVYTGSADLAGAISNRKLFQQISISDIPDFIRYTIKMFALRRQGLLPFGPKIKDFVEIVKQQGLLAYHVAVYKRSLVHKKTLEELYGSKMQVFKMDDIMTDINEIKKLVNFAGMVYNDDWGQATMKTFDPERIDLSSRQQNMDNEIKALIDN